MADSLRSELFRGDSRLLRTLVSDPDHVTIGSRGDFVSKIQFAVLTLEGGSISSNELQGRFYGPETAKAVLDYKRRRQIINKSYQNTADNIVGKMTIRALDDEMLLYEASDRLRNNEQRNRF